MSKAEIAKLSPLRIPRASGLPPHRLGIVDLRKGSGAAVAKTDVVAIRFIEDTYPEALHGRQGGLSGGEVRWPSWSLDEASRGIRLGLPGMKVGGRRELIVPPKVAYPRWKPSWGYAPYVSVYVVDLLGVEPTAHSRLEHQS
jgi:peptidylprolyl isomerase